MMHFDAPSRFRKGWIISIQKKHKYSIKKSWIGDLVSRTRYIIRFDFLKTEKEMSFLTYKKFALFFKREIVLKKFVRSCRDPDNRRC